MSLVNLDRPTVAKLGNLNERLELHDETGRLLDFFEPLGNGERYSEPPITREEIQRRLNAGGGRSLAEILADLEKQS